MHKPSLHIVSPESGSIAEITNDLVEGLREYFDITLDDREQPKSYETLLFHFVNPPAVRNDNFKLFKRKFLIQPIDGTNIHKEYVELFNEFDTIIVPATASANILKENGVTVPIVVIPNYYKPEVLDLCSKGLLTKYIPKDKFVFYHESTLHARKGIELLYEAYIRAFSDTQYVDNVLLVVKDMPLNALTYDRIEKVKGDMMELQKQYKTPARILKISQHLKWSTLQQLWNRTNAYVSCAKIEGFGIPLLRFAYLQKPIVTLDNSNCGYLDFLNNSNSYLTPTQQEIAVGEHMAMYTNQTKWGIPQVEDVSKAMLACYDDWHKTTCKVVKREELAHMEFKNVLKSYVNLLKPKND